MAHKHPEGKPPPSRAQRGRVPRFRPQSPACPRRREETPGMTIAILPVERRALPAFAEMDPHRSVGDSEPISVPVHLRHPPASRNRAESGPRPLHEARLRPCPATGRGVTRCGRPPPSLSASAARMRSASSPAIGLPVSCGTSPASWSIR